MTRHTCVVCGKKRDRQYMKMLHLASNSGYIWICYDPRYNAPSRFLNEESCIDTYNSRKPAVEISGKKDNLDLNCPCSRGTDVLISELSE